MLKSFVLTWLIYWALVLVLPVHSIYPAIGAAFALQLAFVLLVATGLLVAGAALGVKRMPVLEATRLRDARRIVRLAAWLSLLGLVLLVYDKIAIQGVDYSDGLAVAREQWREIGEEREGRASSIFSALGYLVGSSYYVMLVVLLAQPHVFSNRERIVYAAVGFAFALANSVITGGRSNFMLIAMFAVAALTARRGLGLGVVFPHRGQQRGIAIGLALVVAYAVYVFFARAQASGALVELYVEHFLPYMGVDFDPWYWDAVRGHEWLATVGHMTILVVGYLTHSMATFAGIIDGPPESKVILFGNAAGILYKLGLVGRPDDAWFLAGRFPSVPGALWHQFGAVGFVVGALLLGMASGLSCWLAARAPRALFPLGLYAMAGATLILTPYVFAPDFLSFPFVFTAFVILSALPRLRLHGRAARRDRLLPAAVPGGTA